ncbi:MAG: hypothetical protein AAFY88_12050 [Acidobacteriota bacterium]
MRLLIQRSAAVLLAAALVVSLGCTRLTQENFNRIDKGMAFEEVQAILGEPTESKSVGIGPLSGTAASWDDGKTRIEIKFVNEKVQLKSLEKSQADGGG